MSSPSLRSRLDRLEHELEMLKEYLPDDVVSAMDGHATAKDRDARTQLDIGEEYQVVIEEIESDHHGRQAVTHIDGIVVFINPADTDIAVGDTVLIKLTDVKASVAHGLVLRRA